MTINTDNRISRRQGLEPTTRRLNPNQVIFREGEQGDQLFIVKSGAVEIFKTEGDHTVVLDTLQPGALFGEMSLIDGKPRMASARAIGPTALTVISKALFDRKVGNVDPFVRGLLGILSDNARAMGERLVAQNTKTAT